MALQSDAFTQAVDLTTLPDHNPNWVSGKSNIIIRSATGYAGQTAGGSDAMNYWTGGALGDNHYSQVLPKVLGGEWSGPAVRCNGSGGTARGYVTWGGSGSAAIYRMDAGNAAAALMGSPFTHPGVDIPLRLEADGADFLLTREDNGSTLVSFNDTTYGDGYPGVFAYGTGERFDDWEADSVGGGGGGDEQPIARRFSSVPFVGGRLSHGNAGVKIWGRTRDGLIVPHRLAA